MQGGLGGATCVPSRAMLLSGQPLFRVDENLIRDETWPAAFGKAGYRTFVSGKWHNGAQSISKSFQSAKSVFVGGMTNPMKAKLSNVSEGVLEKPTVSGKHACEVFADEAIEFIKAQKDAPFFCYVPFDAPHDPHIVPDDFKVSYNPQSIPVPPNFLPQHPWDNGEMSIRDEMLLPWPRTELAIKALIAEYYRYVSYLDSQIGRILDALESSPHAKNTIIVFSADSGVARGSHGLVGKQNVYEHSMRVPLIIAGDGIPQNQRTDAMCYLFDVLPTVGKLCGVQPPSKSEGLEFTSVLKNPSQPARSSLMLAYKNVQRAVSDGKWKVIRYPLVNKTQLFDLQSDPEEVNNLAEKPEHTQRIKDLLASLSREQSTHGDSSPLSVDKPVPSDWSPLQKNSQPKKPEQRGQSPAAR
jgi:arylsulfatase A-like enzyme